MYGVGLQPAQTAWTNTALPANAFYPSHMPNYPGQVFQQGFQQSQADFAAWATAYHHMVAASMANSTPNAMMPAPPPQAAMPEYLADSRRRTSSGPSSSQSYPDLSLHHQQPQQQQSLPKHQQPQQVQGGFHPYRRGPSQRPSPENINAPAGMPRSASQPTLSTSAASPPSLENAALPDSHRRTVSMESSQSKASVVPPPRLGSRQDSYSSEEKARAASPHARATSSPTVASSSAGQTSRTNSPPARTSQPLHTGPIANATNTPQPSGLASRPSPLSQTPHSAPTEAEKAKSGGFKGRFKKAIEKEKETPVAATPKKQSYSAKFTTKPTFASPSETSTRSATPPATPPQNDDLSPPSAPFSVDHPGSMGSDLSLAETERTATAPSASGKKKGLFRMKNASTDNISLASTVSTASAMIKKMGSIGKLARRNR